MLAAQPPIDGTRWSRSVSRRARFAVVLPDQQPSLLTLRPRFPVFVRVIHRYYSTVRLLGDVHAGRTAWAFSRRPVGSTAGASEVSRFSCMKCLGVSGVYDYAGLNRDSRLRPCPCCLPLDQQRRHPDLVFSKLDTQPTYSPVYASSYTSRCTTQNSGPSGSLLLPRKNFPFSASCRFIPAHWSPTLVSYPARSIFMVCGPRTGYVVGYKAECSSNRIFHRK